MPNKIKYYCPTCSTPSVLYPLTNMISEEDFYTLENPASLKLRVLISFKLTQYCDHCGCMFSQPIHEEIDEFKRDIAKLTLSKLEKENK